MKKAATPSERNPILNNPYEEPAFHYGTSPLDGSLNYEDVRTGRRVFSPDLNVIPVRQQVQTPMFDVNESRGYYEEHLVNILRSEVGKWRSMGYPDTTRVTKELLLFWFEDKERENTKKLFFAQREAVETAIWLNEVAERSNIGQHVLNQLRKGEEQGGTGENFLPRIAFKMATGTGKTVVMAMVILCHYYNRQEYPADTRFADYFLIVTPSITIKDRLGVLKVDTITKNWLEIRDYYRIRKLVPRHYEDRLPDLNARIIITNFHQFEPRTLQGNKKSPFDGKIGEDGKKKEAKEDYNLVLRRLLSGFKKDRRLLVLNDEAHHCYLPKEKGKTSDEDNSKEENERAAVWFTGLREVTKRFKVRSVYDLSATPYFLKGSGYEEYSLFPWVVSDFGLIEAIESGLVKIPFLPVEDTTHNLDEPVLKNLYEHCKKGTGLPKKGARKERLSGEPNLPDILKAALDQFYGHYKKEFEAYYKRCDLFAPPPVLIIVCNNTNVSSEVFRYIAGYDVTDETGESVDVRVSKFDLFCNFNRDTKHALLKPPTLLIDSDALEHSGQIDEQFKKIFKPEIESFKHEYRIKYPGRSAEDLTDAEILREIVNTVGKQNALGSHIRCVVSVSMLTEGWDANTVTHIVGLRAFGSQLLCEQVAGRALRRTSYALGKDGKFAPEYAHIIGVPFKLFKGGKSEIIEPPDMKHIRALPEREAEFEITFPNLVGYREEFVEKEVTADFSDVAPFLIDGTVMPTETTMASAFSDYTEKLTIDQVRQLRHQEIIYNLTRYMVKLYFADSDNTPKWHKFNQVKKVVEEWYNTKMKCTGDAFPQMVYYKKVVEVCEHIMRGVKEGRKSGARILPVFHGYEKFGSTKYVNGNTMRPIYQTKKSHVNYVVADTERWEQIAAKTLEELDEVVSYVKNAFLGFNIPYVCDGKDKNYVPDFIARCQTADGKMINLIIEITGLARDKADKKHYVEKFWLPAVNGVRDQYGYDEWHFIEIAEDIKDIKNQLREKIRGRCESL